jgi:hypothetical protein
MGKFMFVFRGGENVDELQSPEAMEAHMMKWKTWMGGLGQAGILIGGEPLFQEGQVLQGSVVTDGPFAEGKELVGGYVMITADDLNGASEVAKGCPILETTTGTVEVREVRDMS